MYSPISPKNNKITPLKKKTPINKDVTPGWAICLFDTKVSNKIKDAQKILDNEIARPAKNDILIGTFETEIRAFNEVSKYDIKLNFDFPYFLLTCL